MKYRNLYLQKVNLVKNLVALNKKHIEPSDVSAMAKTVGLEKATAIRAWNNFVESGGNIDLRQKQNSKVTNNFQFTHRKSTATKKNSNISSLQAGKIVKDWMKETKRNIDQFCSKNNISVNQFYDWLHELNVSGKLLGRTVLAPSKYAKLDVKIAIWLSKYPNTTRKAIKSLNPLQIDAYKRVIQVLEKFL